MRVTSSGIVNGVIDPKYGMHARELYKGVCLTSLPLKFEDAPAGTKSYAIFMEDRDAAPMNGFSWIHWLAANIQEEELKENASREPHTFVQGVNTKVCPLLPDERRFTKEEASQYQGPGPKDGAHKYLIHVYALDTLLPLENGFFVNELFEVMEGHILAEETLAGLYIK